MTKALADVVVLDMTTEFWASLGVALLGDFGARVVKVEPTGGRGEPLSPISEPQFELANRNKHSLALDHRSEAGRQVLERLISQSDVFVSDSPQLQEQRLDYQSLAALKRDIVYAWASGFGPKGPDRDLPALDELAAARSGMMPILPQPGQPPLYPGNGQMYTTVMLAFGVVAALQHRQRTGEGQEVNVSLFAGNMYGASLDLQAFLAIGGERFLQPVSRLDAGNPMSGTLYPTKDGLWVTLTMPDTDRWWPSLAEVTGLDIADPRFDSHEKRCEVSRLELIAVLEEAFQQQPASHWRDIFTERQMSADVIEQYSYPASDDSALRNRYILPSDEAGASDRKTIGFPIFMSDTPAQLERSAPRAGQDSAELLRNMLGYADGDIDDLVASGVIAE